MALTIMPLGDSITFGIMNNSTDADDVGDQTKLGSGGLGGYRPDLYGLLAATFGSENVSFVGDFASRPARFTDPFFQAVPGILTQELRTGVEQYTNRSEYLTNTIFKEGYSTSSTEAPPTKERFGATIQENIAQHKPDIVLLMIGSNDVNDVIYYNSSLTDSEGKATSRATTDVGNLIRDIGPDTKIFVSSVPLFEDRPDKGEKGQWAYNEDDVAQAWNDGVIEAVSLYSTEEQIKAGYSVHYVDMRAAATYIDPITKFEELVEGLTLKETTDLGGKPEEDRCGCHPTYDGYSNIAQHWYAALQNEVFSPTAVATVAAEAHVGKNLTVAGIKSVDTVDYSNSTAAVTVALSALDQSGIGGAVIDSVKAGGKGSGGYAQGDTYSGIEGVIGSNYGDRVFGSDQGTTARLGFGGDTFDNNETKVAVDIIDGGGGNDRIWTGAGNDKLYGGPQNDSFYGEKGNDWLDGGEGSDVLRGGDNNDTLDGQNGNDSIYGDYGDERYEGNDLIRGGGGSDEVLAGGGNDTVSGGSENDWLNGQWGSDWITGDGGNDVIIGEDGNDTLIGGQGKDYLFGGPGNDTFRFTAVSDFRGTNGDDLIDGFDKPGKELGDRIDLSVIDARSDLSGNQAFKLVSADQPQRGGIWVFDHQWNNATMVQSWFGPGTNDWLQFWVLDGPNVHARDYTADDFIL